MAKWSGLGSAMKRLRGDLTEVSRGLTVSVWKTTIRETPQYAGRMVVSWAYSVNTPETSYRPEMAPTRMEDDNFLPFKRGDREGINIVNQINAGRDLRFKLGDKVYITNGAPHAGSIESGNIDLRSVNWPGRPVDLAMVRFQAKYGAGVPAAAAIQLKLLRIN